MKQHVTDAIVVTCIDFRFQRFIKHWLTERFPDSYEFDRVALAGSIFDLYSILNQIDISNRLHKIKTAILINHEDCGAYGVLGTYERHISDLKRAKRTIIALYPHVKIECYYLHLDGTFEKIS